MLRSPAGAVENNVACAVAALHCYSQLCVGGGGGGSRNAQVHSSATKEIAREIARLVLAAKP